MLMNITCDAVTSVAVHLTFDDGSTKHRLIANGDLVDIEYNGNGLRRHVEGKVLKVSAVGTDTKGWYIIVDASDDFDSNQHRISVMSILDCEIIRKASTLKFVQTPLGAEGVPYLRIIDGRLQYSKDGQKWESIHIDDRDIIKDEEGTIPNFSDSSSSEEDIISDESY